MILKIIFQINNLFICFNPYSIIIAWSASLYCPHSRLLIQYKLVLSYINYPLSIHFCGLEQFRASLLFLLLRDRLFNLDLVCQNFYKHFIAFDWVVWQILMRLDAFIIVENHLFSIFLQLALLNCCLYWEVVGSYLDGQQLDSYSYFY